MSSVADVEAGVLKHVAKVASIIRMGARNCMPGSGKPRTTALVPSVTSRFRIELAQLCPGLSAEHVGTRETLIYSHHQDGVGFPASPGGVSAVRSFQISERHECVWNVFGRPEAGPKGEAHGRASQRRLAGKPARSIRQLGGGNRSVVP